jgi:hypothetical protein
MQAAINIFTILGSLIGITSFLMTMFSSIHNYNIKKWEKLSSIIDFCDIEDFYTRAGMGYISSYKEDKLRLLTDNIRIKSETVQFKGFAKKKIEERFAKILVQADKFNDEVQVPRWEIHSNEESGCFTWRIDKNFFYMKYDYSPEYDSSIRKSIDNAYEPLKEIDVLYREIYSLANKLPYEFILRK